jgi:ribosomal protein S27AE
MPDDDWEDEDWDDVDQDDLDEQESPCPECGAAVYTDANQCRQCGYWMTEADRDAASARTPKSKGVRIVAAVVLLAFLMGLFAGGLALF